MRNRPDEAALGVPRRLRRPARPPARRRSIQAAQAWFEHLGRGGTAGGATVAQACARYVKHLRTHKTDRAANDADARFKNYVLNNPKLASTELTKLAPLQLEAWRKALKEPRGPFDTEASSLVRAPRSIESDSAAVALRALLVVLFCVELLALDGAVDLATGRHHGRVDKALRIP